MSFLSHSSIESNKGKQISPLIHTQENANLTWKKRLRKESTKEIAFLRPDQLESPVKYILLAPQSSFDLAVGDTQIRFAGCILVGTLSVPTEWTVTSLF